ncbi:MAG: ComEC/Rec2 family competence protein [Minisyncoccia bacterium]
MIYSAVIGFLSGIALGSFVHLSSWLLFAILLLSVLLFGYGRLFSGKEKLHLTILSIFILALLFGVARITFSDLYKKSSLENFANKKIIVEGIVVDEPDVREKNTKLTVEINKLTHTPDFFTETKINEKILVSVPMYPEYFYGDKVRMNLTLEEPKNFSNEDGRVFDYKGYLRVRGIWYTSRFAKLELLSSGNGNPVKSLLFRVKQAFTDSISKALPEPESSLLGGLLLGSKQSLGKDLLTEFQKTGVSHIVVLSGYNIAIVAKNMMSLFSFLPNNLSFSVGAVSVVLFTALSGGGASATRASIMVLVALFAKQFNRDYKANRVLGFTIVLMLAPNPLLLVYDPSFQLSVLATIGIIFVAPIFEKYFGWVTERFGLREIVSSTVATQFTVLPFLVYNTGLLSLVSLPVNVLILGTIPTTMFLGFLTGMLGLVSIYLAFIPALFTHSLLWYQLFVIHVGSIVPFGYMNLPSFSFPILVIIYLFIFFILYKLRPARIRGGF